MSHRLRVLHVSDLHVVDPAKDRYRQRRGLVLGDAWDANLDEIAKDGPIDLVCFTGDLAFSGSKAEYERLTVFVDALLARVGVPRSRFFVVPGNHDADRTIAPAAVLALRKLDDEEKLSAWMIGGEAPRGINSANRKAVLERQGAYREWVRSTLQRPQLLPGPDAAHPTLGYRETIRVRDLPFDIHIIGLDSAWLAHDDNDAGKLRLTRDQVLRLSAGPDGERLGGFRLALIHHPLTDLADGGTSRRLLAEQIDLLLRGHLHNPELSLWSDADRGLRELAAGSLYGSDLCPTGCQIVDISLDGVGRPIEYDLWVRGWSNRGFWVDEDGLYKQSKNGRLSWPRRVGLRAVGLAPDALTTSEVVAARPATKPAPEPRAAKAPLFTWLHLSDIHIGHKDTNHKWDQELVFDALRKDITKQIGRGTPAPSVILVTGDIAFSGTVKQYEGAKTWLLELATRIKISVTHIFLVPGNHDVDRNVDKANRDTDRLVRNLRNGSESLDDALADVGDKAHLILRMQPYLSFAADFPSIQTPDPFFWSHSLTSPAGLQLRLIGLNTALLAADAFDKGKLRLGKQALARTLLDLPEGELAIVLSHHPFRGDWLADQRESDNWIKGRADIHLSGHVHEADSEDARSGSGTSLLRITAGAVHGDTHPPGVPASHGYSMAAVIPGDDGSLRLRVWPRRWSEKKADFVLDADNTHEGLPYTEHPLPGLRAPGAGWGGRNT